MGSRRPQDTRMKGLPGREKSSAGRLDTIHESDGRTDGQSRGETPAVG